MNERLDFNKFANVQKDLRKETTALMEQAVERAWVDMEEFPRVLNLLENFNRTGDSLGGGSSNALLLYAQCPGAVQLGSFEFWKEENAFIRKGQKGLKVLVRGKNPKAQNKFFYNVEHRFDVSQTNAPPPPELPDWADPLDIIKAIAKTCDFGIRYDDLPDGADAVYIPELNEVRVRDGQDREQMCHSLLTEFCHYQQAKDMGTGYQRDADRNFVALCGAHVLERRFGVGTGQARFQREAFPPLPTENPQERVGMVKSYLSKIIHTTGEVSRELRRGIRELERDCGEIIAPPGREKPEAVAI